MKRIIGLCIAFCAVSVFAAAQTDVRMTDSEIGPVRAGMHIAELRALGYPYRTRAVNSEGVDYTEYVVQVEDGAEIEALDIDGVAADLGTGSTTFATDRGARVGATLAELQALYPEGSLHVGVEEGHGTRFFSFVTHAREPSGVFYFDVDRLSPECFAQRESCSTLSAERASYYRAIYQDPMTSLRARAIGPIELGMTETQVAALGLPITRSGARTTVTVADNRSVNVLFRNRRAWRLTTISSDFVAYRGGRVGATLDQLRSYYPEGHIVGEDGRYLSFVIAPGHAFKVDTSERTDACTRWDGQPCPAFGLTHAIEYSVTDEH